MDSIFQMLLDGSILLLGLTVFVILSVASEVGYRLGRRRAGRAEADSKESTATSTLTGGMLALLAFLLGLSINFAQNRFEARRELVVVEANTIGTAWLRAKLVGGPQGEAMASLIETYAKTRLEFTRASPGQQIDALNQKTGQEQNQIWAIATSLARQSPTAITASLIAALNEMIDASLSQRHAFESRVPGNMVVLLLIGSIIAISAMGFNLGMIGSRETALTSLLLLMWTGGLVMTVDLARPRIGNIRVDTAPLEWTIKGFGESPGAPPAPMAPTPPTP